MRDTSTTVLIGALAFLTACGGGGSSAPSQNVASSGANVLPISISAGPVGIPNMPLASVVVCVPGSSTCQTINNVLVDTGSEGLRILSSALTAPLPPETISSNPVAECVQFADGSFNWGSVRLADVKLSGEQASSTPVQVIGDMEANIPSNCSTNAMTGGSATNDDSLNGLGANGILGVGAFRQDCGPNCPSTPANLPANMYFPYYVCPSGGTCTPTAVALAQQLQNPVWMFSKDNNGVIIELPQIASTGAASATGSLVFGIGTQSNNGLSGATILTLDGGGNFTTTFNGTALAKSFIDSGSNGYFFPNLTNIVTCTNTGTFGSGITSFYCPSSTLNLSATNTGLNGTTSSVSFSVANSESLFNGNNLAFNDLAGIGTSGSFDWGIPFFYGRNVFTAIEGQSTPSGTGPYFAY